MLRRIFWSPFPVFAVNSVWFSGVCEHNLYSPGFFYAICRCQSLYEPVIYMSKHSFFKKKVLKSLCEIITYEMELSYGTSIFRRETKFDKHDRFWTTNVSCPGASQCQSNKRVSLAVGLQPPCCETVRHVVQNMKSRFSVVIQ